MSDSATKPKLLTLDLWGIGDLAFATGFLRQAVQRFDVTLAAKPHAQGLLAPSFPEVKIIPYDPPWSVFRGKYRLWNWRWKPLLHFIRALRHERFDAAVSVRNDPRDHLLMWLAGAKACLGFPTKGSGIFLNQPIRRAHPKQHKVEDWRQLGLALRLDGMEGAGPWLDHPRYRSERVTALLAGVDKPLVVLHAGARIAVRRWPLPYYETIIRRLREEFDFHLALIPDPDGYGRELAPRCEQELPPLSLGEMVDVMGRAELLLCNDSGPGHVAAACGRPVIVMFGPTDPDWFRPFGPDHHVVIRDLCRWRPCFDHCKFPEPFCMTKLLPDEVWPEIRNQVLHLIANGVITSRLSRGGRP